MTEIRDTRWRWLPPVHSPVHLPAVAGAATRLLPGGGGRNSLERLRSRLEGRFRAQRCLLTSSGTGALTLALRAGIRRAGSPRVALPAYACFDVATAAAGADARALLYDLDPETLAPDRDSLAAVLRRGARTIVIVHAYGHPVDVAAVRELTDRFDALLIDDAAQGAGGRLAGRPLGAHGDLSVLSFGRGKGRSAGGGGAILGVTETAADLLGEEADLLGSRGARWGGRELTVALGQWLLGRPALYRIPASLPFLALGETTYRPPRPVQPMATAAAELRLRTPDALEEEEAARRRRTAAAYREALRDVDGVQTVRPVDGAHSGALRFPLLLDRPTGGHPPLGIMPGYPTLLDEIEAFRPFLAEGNEATPGAARLRDRLVTLPTHGRLRTGDLDAVVAWVRAEAGG